MAGDFDLEDLRQQLRMIMNMGPLDKLLGMIPGVGAQLKNLKIDESKFKKMEAIINSMIAKGSGTTISDVNKLLKQYEEMKKMMKKLKKISGVPKLPRFPFGF